MCKDDAATDSEHLQAPEDQNKEVINNSTMISCGPMISVLPYLANKISEKAAQISRSFWPVSHWVRHQNWVLETNVPSVNLLNLAHLASILTSELVSRKLKVGCKSYNMHLLTNLHLLTNSCLLNYDQSTVCFCFWIFNTIPLKLIKQDS